MLYQLSYSGAGGAHFREWAAAMPAGIPDFRALAPENRGPGAPDGGQSGKVMRSRGITLAELLVALAISAVLLATAAPGFSRQRANAALGTAAGQAMAALHLARRLALARGQSMTVCLSADGQQCGFAGREWLLFANEPGGSDSRRDGDEVVLRRWSLPRGVLVTGSRGYAAFQSRPGSAATVTFRFRHPLAPGAGRDVVVSQTGRPRLEMLPPPP